MEAASDKHLSKQLHRMVAQKISRKSAKHSHGATRQAVEDALSDLFIAGITKIEEWI